MSIEAELLILPEVKDSDLNRAVTKIDNAFKKSARSMQMAYQKAAFEGTMKGIQIANQQISRGGGAVTSGVSSSTASSTTNIYNNQTAAGGVNPLLAAGALYMFRPKSKSFDNSTLKSNVNRMASMLASAEKRGKAPLELMDFESAARISSPRTYAEVKKWMALPEEIVKAIQGSLDPSYNKLLRSHYDRLTLQYREQGMQIPTTTRFEEASELASREFLKTPQGRSYARRNMMAGALKRLPGAAGMAIGAGVAAVELYDMSNQYIQQQSGQRIGTWTPYIEQAAGRKEPDWVARAKSLGVPLEAVSAHASLYGVTMDQALDDIAGIQNAQAQARYYGDKKHAFAKVKNESFDVVIKRFNKGTLDEQRLIAQDYPSLQRYVGKTVTPEQEAAAAEKGKADKAEIERIAERVTKVRDMQSKLDEVRLESMMEIVKDGTLKAYYDLEVKKMKDAVANAAQAKEDADKFMTASERIADSGALYEKAAVIFSNAVAMFTGKSGEAENMTVTVNLGLNDSASQSLAVGQLPTHIPGAKQGTGMNNVWNVQTRTSYTPND